ncbi:Os08g0254200 [Oryza sativa Japonica Group]|uniref:Os08g0254200 protein n=2 Tax=Oryza sativa subsp. japonica TaxID=39947 RepID=Q0J6X1_ORYSJ|nr:Os08g0254200 [Oryza sativa Japonica Group]BAT04567.1 Os08g0254200 [Oryza sativa Japonica Group]|eukprot:NP_001061380.1 Os08g0254200 [Oryza sativa Japonica Group]
MYERLSDGIAMLCLDSDPPPPARFDLCLKSLIWAVGCSSELLELHLMIAHNKDGICNPNLPRSTSSRQALSLCTQSLIHVFCT